MIFNWDLKVPAYYQGTYLTIRSVARILEEEGYEWAVARRHLALMHSRGGKLGPGGTWRKTPSNTSPASQRGESFHQDQDYANGHRGPTAIDYVWEDGPDAGVWHDTVPTGGVPVQGSAEAEIYGIHANVGMPGKPGFESWHGQPIEIDGWGSATGNGTHPAPTIRLDYPLPAEHSPDGGEQPQEETVRTLDKPIRVYDSRPQYGGLYDDNKGKFKANEKRDIKVSSDSSVEAVFVNITVVNTRGAGFVTAYGGTQADVPAVSNVNWSGANQVHPNLALVPTHDDHIHIFASQACDVIVDLQGIVRGG